MLSRMLNEIAQALIQPGFWLLVITYNSGCWIVALLTFNLWSMVAHALFILAAAIAYILFTAKKR